MYTGQSRYEDHTQTNRQLDTHKLTFLRWHMEVFGSIKRIDFLPRDISQYFLKTFFVLWLVEDR